MTVESRSLRAMEPAPGVDLEALALVADAHASEVWGSAAGRGAPFPVNSADGDVCAYVFPYARSSGIGAAGETHERTSEQYGGIYVAAQPIDHPVLRVVDVLHSALLPNGRAVEMGRAVLGDDAQISRIYWLGLHQEYVELAAVTRRLLVDVDTMTAVDPDLALRSAVTNPATAVAGGGRSSAADGVQSPVLKLVPLPECVPVIDWSYWCAPTAWSMATCYYDTYVPGPGGHLGYGRLVGYWLDHVELQNGPAHITNIPDYLNQLIDPTLDPPTWRQGFTGWTEFMEHTFGYGFSSRDVAATSENDWAWGDMQAEIDAGRPFVWGVPDHSTCAFGYRVAADGSKRVVIYNTWGATAQQQREEWLYTKGTGISCITPGGATTGQGLAVASPPPSLRTNIPTTISWHVWGDQITVAEVAASNDGGVTWAIVRAAAPCQAGWNSCDWTPQVVSPRVRVRVRGSDAAGTYVAGDGSRTNLDVTEGPRTMTLNTILVKAQTDAGGFFSAAHGLERYTPDGYAIRAMTVAVQHKNGNWHTLEMSSEVDNRFWWNRDVVAGLLASPNFFNQPVQVVVFAEHVVG